MEDNEPSQELIAHVHRFKCTEAWIEEFGDPFKAERDYNPDLLSRFAAFRSAMFQVHYRALSDDDRRSLDDETHPSYKHEWVEKARPYADDLKKNLSGIDYVEDVGVGAYHGDTVVLQVRLTKPVTWQEYRKHIPELFRGFMVFVVLPTAQRGPQ